MEERIWENLKLYTAPHQSVAASLQLDEEGEGEVRRRRVDYGHYFSLHRRRKKIQAMQLSCIDRGEEGNSLSLPLSYPQAIAKNRGNRRKRVESKKCPLPPFVTARTKLDFFSPSRKRREKGERARSMFMFLSAQGKRPSYCARSKTPRPMLVSIATGRCTKRFY